MNEVLAVVEAENEELQAKVGHLDDILKQQDELIQSLRNELSILQKAHGEACQGWSKWQQVSERHEAALKYIRMLANDAVTLDFKRSILLGMLTVIERSARSELPEFDEIPY
jgi:hypothetical protein